MKQDNQPQCVPLWKLFLYMFTISACTFGGGFVIASLIKKKFVDQFHWIKEDEMMDYIAIAQSCPGAIAVNTAILTGLNLRGFIGMIVAVLATILPPMLILSAVSLFYSAFLHSKPIALLLKGMQAGISAVILDVVLSLGLKVVKSKSILLISIMFLAFAIEKVLRINAVYVIIFALLVGIGRAIIQALRKGVGHE